MVAARTGGVGASVDEGVLLPGCYPITARYLSLNNVFPRDLRIA